MTSILIEAMEKRILPDFAIRFGIRNLCKDRLKSISFESFDQRQNELNKYIKLLKQSPVAIETQAANEQHYELPARFFQLVLGKNRKYSSSYWPKNCHNLDAAEDFALEETVTRAELKDGMNILELGCGWGSLTLFMARKYPNAKITAVSNSHSQREFIMNLARSMNLHNVNVLTHNVAELKTLDQAPFDRVVSVEMFEHLRNYEEILGRISGWLKDDGKLFIHIFTHKDFPYFFETEGDDNWMGKYFFTGGQMPSHDLLKYFNKDLKVEKDWVWDGTHYGKTSEAWLENMDKNAIEIMDIMIKAYGKENASRWVQRWRVFFMSCAELFNYKNGQEWQVSHYLFKK